MKYPASTMLTPPDSAALWRFFDGVSTAVASRMLQGSSPGEENLTFLLCELLDESSTALHVLEYSLADLRETLEDSDSGTTIDVTFETHEHSKHIESRYSGADLGVVFEIKDPILGTSRRAALVQAKRLFPVKRGASFELGSGYDSFHHKQLNFLKLVSKKFKVYNSVFYMWYNPASTALREDDAKIVRSYEARNATTWPWLGLHGRMHPILDEFIEMGLAMPYDYRTANPVSPSSDDASAREWRSRQPAVRVSCLDRVTAIAEGGRTPTLRDLYEASIRNPRWPELTFSPLADFFLHGFASRRLGSTEAEWVRLAEGNKVPLPTPDAKPQTHGNLDLPDAIPAPRHTIRVTIRSTLNQEG